jgi:iron complex outermembrane receptor protein
MAACASSDASPISRALTRRRKITVRENYRNDVKWRENRRLSPRFAVKHARQSASHLTVVVSFCYFMGVLTTVTQSISAAQAVAPGAQSSQGEEIPDIVVTAQRRRENLQDVPVTVEAFSAEQVRTSVLTSLTDLGTLTPGLIASTEFGYFEPHLRGVGTTAASTSVENPIAVYVDGVYYGSQTGSIFQLEGIDHIEVDKGPQGTLFGRNATGGLIQIVTKDPGQSFSATARVTAGDYETLGGSLYMTGRITPILASNVSVYYQNQGTGFGTNYFNHKYVNKAQNFAIREKNLFTPTEYDSLMLAFDYEQDHSSPVLIPAPGTTPLGGPPYTGSRWSANGFYQPVVIEKQGGASLKYDHDFGFAKLASISAYLQSSLYSDLDGTFVVNPIYTLDIPLLDLHKQITQEFDLRSDPNSSVAWATGIFYYQSTARYDPGSLVGGLIAPLNLFSIYSRATDHSIAAFAQATKQILDATNLTVGLRDTYEGKSFSETQLGYPRVGPVEVFGSVSDVKLSSNQPTWRISLDHKVTPEVLLYASYNRGYKTGGFNDIYLPVQAYEPEILDAYEIGAKTNLLDHRLLVNMAGFYYNYRNLQTVAYPQGSLLVYNAPGATIAGVDLDFKVAPFANFIVSGGAEALKANYRDFPNALLSTPAPGGGSTLTTFNAIGRLLPMSPKWTADVSPLYNVPLGNKGMVSLGVTFSYTAGFYYEPDNRFHQSSYGLVNASVNWADPTDLWSARLWGKNLTNRAYTVAEYAQTNADYAQYAPPRTFGVTVSRHF